MDAQPLRAGGEITRIIDRYQSAVYGLAPVSYTHLTLPHNFSSERF